MYKGSRLCGDVVFSVTEFSPQMAHCHCEDCRKFHGAAHSDEIEIALATLRTSQTLLPDAHVFTASKVPWVTIHDSLPKFDRNRHT